MGNTLPEIVAIADGFVSLGLVIYLLFYDRKENKAERAATLKKDEAQQAELKAARDAHIATIKQHNEDYAGLLEKSLVALRDMAGVQKDHLTQMENRIINRFASEIEKLKNN